MSMEQPRFFEPIVSPGDGDDGTVRFVDRNRASTCGHEGQESDGNEGHQKGRFHYWDLAPRRRSSILAVEDHQENSILPAGQHDGTMASSDSSSKEGDGRLSNDRGTDQGNRPERPIVGQSKAHGEHYDSPHAESRGNDAPHDAESPPYHGYYTQPVYPTSFHSTSYGHPVQYSNAPSFVHGFGGPQVVMTPAASFESHGSGPFTPTYMMGAPGAVLSYSYGPQPMIAYPGHPPQAPFPTWIASTSQPVEYIKNIKATDVLCGRGGATNSHSGNRAFRILVKRHQASYLRAKKRDKPSVASKVVEVIRTRGGRFLRRCEPAVNGNVLWVDIGDDRAREKTCQALREGAPELRRKRRKGLSIDEDDMTTRTLPSCEDDMISTASSVCHKGPPVHEPGVASEESRRCNRRDKHVVADSDGSVERDERDDAECSSIIHPSAQLMKQEVAEISVDDLWHEERELYKAFAPPRPTAKKVALEAERQLTPRRYTSYEEHSDESEDDTGWSSFEEV